MKKSRIVHLLLISISILGAALFFSANDTAIADSTTGKDISLDEIMGRVESRYAGTGFTAEFKQESTVKAMDITDTASGRLFVKRPDKMRWEYTEPEPQIIISDGAQLWVYRPEDNQVMVGSAPTFFGGGKGAGFLTDINAIRRDFDVTREKGRDKDRYVLKLIPRKKTQDIREVLLFISSKTFDLERVVTYNSYGDETRIDLLNLKLNVEPNPDLFNFSMPEGVEVLELES